MIISNKIQDAQSAKAHWLEKRLELDELHLFDYERPLKKITQIRISPFQSRVARYGFISALYREVRP